MKRLTRRIAPVLLASLLVLATGMLTACTKPFDIPMGIWKSEDPEIVLYVDPEYVFPNDSYYHLGTYVKDNNELKVFTVWSSFGPLLEIHGVESMKKNSRRGDEWLLSGTPRLEGDVLYYSCVDRESGERLDIIFTRLEEYEPIKITDWFPTPRDEWIDDGY